MFNVNYVTWFLHFNWRMSHISTCSLQKYESVLTHGLRKAVIFFLVNMSYYLHQNYLGTL